MRLAVLSAASTIAAVIVASEIFREAMRSCVSTLSAHIHAICLAISIADTESFGGSFTSYRVDYIGNKELEGRNPAKRGFLGPAAPKPSLLYYL
jgi:hypothetical protein